VKQSPSFALSIPLLFAQYMETMMKRLDLHHVLNYSPPEKSWNFFLDFPGPEKFCKMSLVLNSEGN